MAKYHINGKGEPGLCRAKQKCPFSDLTEDHYASKQEARLAYEQRRSPASPPAALSKEKLAVEARKASRIGAYRSLKAIREFSDEEYGQAEFDSTLTGKLSLQRRLLGEKYSELHLG